MGHFSLIDTREGTWAATQAKTSPQLTASKEVGNSMPQPPGSEFCQQPEGVWQQRSPALPRERPSPADDPISAEGPAEPHCAQVSEPCNKLGLSLLVHGTLFWQEEKTNT